MKLPRTLILVLFTFLFLCVLSWNAYLYTLPTHETRWNFYYNLGYGVIFLFGAVMSIFYGKVFGFKSNIGKMLLFLGLGLMGWVSGLSIWVYYNEVLHVEVPYPSWADYAGFMHIFYLIPIACFYLLQTYKSLITKNVLRDSIIIFIFSFALIFGLFSRPDLSSQVSIIEKIFNIYYPAGDVVGLALVLISLRIGGGKIHPSLYIFFLGLLLQVAGDLLYSYRTATEIYWNGDISDLLFTFAAYFMSIGIFEIIYNLNQVAKKEPSSIQSPQTTPMTNAAGPGSTISSVSESNPQN